MDQLDSEKIDEETLSENPEDVAVLYSWAKLQGAKYRDFSASRRAYRAQMRHRAAEAQRESETVAQIEAEATAAATEKAAREAEDAARFHESAARVASRSAQKGESAVEEAASARAMRAASELARRASTERIEAARRAEAVAAAEAAALREEREMAEAHASARRQEQRYNESDVRRRVAAGPQPTSVGGEISDPYTDEQHSVKQDRIYQQLVVPEEDMLPARYRQSRDSHRIVVPQPDPVSDAPGEYWADSLDRDSELAATSVSSNGAARFYEPKLQERERRLPPVPEPRETYTERVTAPRAEAPRVPQGYRPEYASGLHPAYVEREAQPRARKRVEVPPEPHAEDLRPEHEVPAWIYSQPPEPAAKRPSQPMSPVEDTLQHSRERVASRWFALKGVFDQGAQEAQQEAQTQRVKETRAPLLTVFSLAGGVGKTSLIATLGRALSSTGERVLLTDTTSHGLLPFYFGASELRAGTVRTFSPPPGSADAPIYLVSYDVNQKNGDAETQDWLADEVTTNSRGMQRVLVDLMPGVAWVARRLARMNSTILVPVAPDMNSVISLQGVERFFGGMVDSEGRAVQPYYVLNQFDASLPLHLDVREVMRQQLGDRLLPFAIRRSPSVSEALAEGMTVIDYAPDSPVAGDYMNLVSWLRTLAAPAASGFRNARWSER